MTAVARGLTRVLRLWDHQDKDASPWQILVLVHSIEALDCLRMETACSVVTLPWLKPLSNAEDFPLETDPITGPERRQCLAELIESPPATDGAENVAGASPATT